MTGAQTTTRKKRNGPEAAFGFEGAGEQYLSVLLDIGRTMAGSHELRTAMHRALEVLGRPDGIPGGVVMLRDSDTDELHIAALEGSHERNGADLHYRIG